MPEPSVQYPAALDTATSLLTAVNVFQATTTLGVALGIADTSATVVTTTGFPANGYILVESEIIYYASLNSTQFLGLIRGANGTTAAAHGVTLTVKQPIAAANHNLLRNGIVAIQTELGILPKGTYLTVADRLADSVTLAASHSANLILASPDGSAGASSFRALVNNDLPVVGITKGGTGQITANDALNALLPSQTAQTGKALVTDGTNVSWQTTGGLSGSGTVGTIAKFVTNSTTLGDSIITENGTGIGIGTSALEKLTVDGAIGSRNANASLVALHTGGTNDYARGLFSNNTSSRFVELGVFKGSNKLITFSGINDDDPVIGFDSILYIGVSGNTTPSIRASGGKVHIGSVSAPTEELQVAGSISTRGQASASIYAIHDGGTNSYNRFYGQNSSGSRYFELGQFKGSNQVLTGISDDDPSLTFDSVFYMGVNSNAYTLKVSNGVVTVNGKLTVTGAIDPTYIEFTQVSTPSTPSATHNRLYFKSNDNLYMLNSSGTETQVNGGGIGGSIADQQVAYGSGTAITGSSELTYVSTAGHFNVRKDQNADTALQVMNNTNGTSSYALLNLYRPGTVSGSTVMQLGAFGSAYTDVPFRAGFGVISSAALSGLQMEISTGTFAVTDSSQNLFLVQSGGNVGIGTTPGAFKLDVNGNVRITGKLTVTGAIDPTYIEFTQVSTPSTPSATYNRLYFKSNDNLYMLNSSGTETQVNGGGGGITGSGTTGTIPKFTSSTAVGDSIITENAARILIGGGSFSETLTVTGTLSTRGSADTRVYSISNGATDSLQGFDILQGSNGVLFECARGADINLSGAGNDDAYIGVRGTSKFFLGNTGSGARIKFDEPNWTWLAGAIVNYATGVHEVYATSGAGTKHGTSPTQLQSFWDAAPIVQPATTGTTAGFTANTSANILYNESTFTGGTGSKAYTVSDVVLALKTSGIMAAS